MTAAPAPQFDTLAAMIRAQARRHGARAALCFRERTTSYAALDAASDRVARALAGAGIRRGDRIAYLGRNRDSFYEILLGAAKAAVVLVPINWRLAPPEVDWILSDSGCRLLFATPECAASLAGSPTAPSVPRIILDAEEEGARNYEHWRDSGGRDPEVEGGPEDIAVQLYTSGTTGRPKGAMLSQRALMAFRSLPPEAQPAWNRWNADDVSLIIMPQFHIGGTGFGLQTLCAGATGLVEEEFSAEAVLHAIEHRGLSKFFTVPSAIQILLQHPRVREVDYSRIRTIVYGASPITMELLHEAMQVFDCDFVQQYGMTEMCGTVAVLGPEDHRAAGSPRMASAGRPLPGVGIAILDAEGRPLPAGETGEVAIRAPTCMAGYWNLPEATAEAMSGDGFFRTGDAGFLDSGGYLFLRDRLKDMIVSGGENVFPAEVEGAIWSHPAVREVAVIGVPDLRWGEAVKAIVVAEPGQKVEAAELQAWARARIAGFKVPKSIDFVAALPHNQSGKVLRRELRAPFWAGHDRAIS